MAAAILTIHVAGIMGIPELAFLGGIGSTEILMILVVMLLLFGPKQLPELAKTIGNALRGIRKATDEMKEEIGFDDIVNPRSSRPRNYRPRKNVPPSLQESDGPPSATTQISEGGEEQASTLVPSEALPAQQNQSTVPPDSVPEAQPQATIQPDSSPEPQDQAAVPPLRQPRPETADQPASSVSPPPAANEEPPSDPPKQAPKEEPES
jgi:sec-independent protein translocase protein TatA